MIGPRTNIVLVTSFFTLAFALLFFALVQNYAHAAILQSIHGVAVAQTSDTNDIFTHEIVPNFGAKQQTPGFDFDSDASFQKYLNTDHPFTDDSYTPTDLIPIDSNFTANNSKAFKLRQEAAVQFADMAWHFRNTFSGDRLSIDSAYRSKGLQDYLIKQGCSSTKCAQVGTSEHQAGLAVDLRVVAKRGKSYSLDLAYPNKYYDRLKTNAAVFGFHNTYQKGVDIDGKVTEGWHRRYLGVELATLLMNNNQTFAEYYNSTKNE